LACHGRDALEGQHTTQDLPYGLNVWHAGTQVLSVLWAEAGAFKELNRIGFRLYEGFQPDVPSGAAGWGVKAVLDVSKIRGGGKG